MARPPCERVLVVDDNEGMLDSMEDALESGATVCTATSSDEAFAILASGSDVSGVVVDVRLARGEHGARLAERLRMDPRFSDFPERLRA